MNSSVLKQIDLPIEGMTCAACAARIEKNLNKLPGVRAAVNFANEKARIEFDATATSLEHLVHSIEKAGFQVVPQSVQLQITGMTCAACSGRIEKALNALPGVTANVNLATEVAHARFNPGAASVEDLIAAVTRTGLAPPKSAKPAVPRKKARRRASYQAELRMFWISAALSLPLMLQMVPMFWGDHMELPRGLQLLLATPVQFWVGRRFYIGAWNALRGGGANMDVLVALGTSMAYLLSAAGDAAGGGSTCLLRSKHRYHHAGAAGQIDGSPR